MCSSLANLEELPDYERRLDRRDAARCNKKNMCVSFAPVFCCDESLNHEDVREADLRPALLLLRNFISSNLDADSDEVDHPLGRPQNLNIENGSLDLGGRMRRRLCLPIYLPGLAMCARL